MHNLNFFWAIFHPLSAGSSDVDSSWECACVGVCARKSITHLSNINTCMLMQFTVTSEWVNLHDIPHGSAFTSLSLGLLFYGIYSTEYTQILNIINAQFNLFKFHIYIYFVWSIFPFFSICFMNCGDIFQGTYFSLGCLFSRHFLLCFESWDPLKYTDILQGSLTIQDFQEILVNCWHVISIRYFCQRGCVFTLLANLLITY